MPALKLIFKASVVIIMGLVALWIILGIASINSAYIEEMFVYRENEICIACLNGSRHGVCPHLFNPDRDNDLAYPNATETVETGGARLNSPDFSERNILNYGLCEERHRDKDFISRFMASAVPKKSFAKGMTKSSDMIGGLFVMGICIFFGCRM